MRVARMLVLAAALAAALTAGLSGCGTVRGVDRALGRTVQTVVGAPVKAVQAIERGGHQHNRRRAYTQPSPWPTHRRNYNTR
jgi:hypothetical protein